MELFKTCEKSKNGLTALPIKVKDIWIKYEDYWPCRIDSTKNIVLGGYKKYEKESSAQKQKKWDSYNAKTRKIKENNLRN